MAITINGSSAAGNIDLGTNGTITDLAEGGLPDDSVAIADLSATGTASSSTFLRGDNAWATPVAGLYGSWAAVGHREDASTAAGTFTHGAYRIRVIDEEIYDPDGIVTLSSNQFTLQAGTYKIWWNFPGYQVDKHNTKLYNVTDTANVAAGTAEKSGDSENTQTRSSGFTRVTISGAKAFEIRHICAVTKSSNGLGENAHGSDMSTNYIGWVQILKEN